MPISLSIDWISASVSCECCDCMVVSGGTISILPEKDVCSAGVATGTDTARVRVTYDGLVMVAVFLKETRFRDGGTL